ncbi:MAG TPA: alkaline phosphatase family protein [Candidatus Deferrimicrobiaceae bacterium]|nr:alkaline phosphatase family protein [Candidatus Deferrimicrobiaceae bacterium]
MRRKSYFVNSAVCILSVSLATAVIAACTCSDAAAQVVPLAQHVVLVIDENTSFGTVYPSGMPWLVKQGNRYGYASNYSSDHSGSLLDYLYLASGSCESNYSCSNAPACSLPSGSHNFYCNGNDCFMQSSCEATVAKDPITDENIFSLMNNQPISWKVYTQNYLNAGGNVNVPDFTSANQPPFTNYYARHNAAVWYEEVLSNTLGSQGNIVDFEQFGIDVANGTLPRFAIIVPDGCWDLHDSCSSLTNADDFLNSNLTPMLNTPDFQAGGSGLLLVTFDNGDGDEAGRIFTAVIGPNVKAGQVSEIPYKHENALRTMLDALGIQSYPGWSAGAADMADFFSPTSGSVVINSPANGSTQGASLLVNAAASELSAQVDHMEVWDTFNGKATKLGNVFSKTIDQAFSVSGNGAHQMTIQDIGGPPSYKTLHKEVTSYTRSSTYGVFVKTPAKNSTQGTLFPLSAFAVEAGAERTSSGIDHIEVWNGDTKLGDSPRGNVVSQWYSLEPGNYTLTVQDVNSSEQRLHETKVNFTVSSTPGVHINSPANNSVWSTTTVPINAYAFEQDGSKTPLVDHIEVWDSTHGVKLGESPTGVGVNSAFINQKVTLPKAGSYELAIMDINPNNGYKPIHTSYVSVTVK